MGLTRQHSRAMAKPESTGLDTGAAGAPDRASAVQRLFREHNRALVSFLRARLRSEQEARDVAQEAYVRLLQLEDPSAVSFLRSYLFRIAANLAVDRLRERSVREETRPDEIFEGIADERIPERIVIAKEELDVVRQALMKLPDNCRRALISYVFEGCSTVQIAAAMGLTDRTIRLYIAQGLAVCRSKLDAARAESGECKP